jgi:hypothetical protein
MGKYSWDTSNKWFEEWVRVEKRRQDGLKRVCEYALAFGKSKGIKDLSVSQRCNKIIRYVDSKRYPRINFVVKSSNLHNCRRIAGWAKAWIEENNIKDQKAKNIIHHINCWCHLFYRPHYPGA